MIDGVTHSIIKGKGAGQRLSEADWRLFTTLVRFDAVYYGSHPKINPTGIMPLGPELDFTAPHDRGRFGN